MIAGPDPSALTDESLRDAAYMVRSLGEKLAGARGAPVTYGGVADLADPARRWLIEALQSLFEVLCAENDHRLGIDTAALIAGVEQMLAKEAGES